MLAQCFKDGLFLWNVHMMRSPTIGFVSKQRSKRQERNGDLKEVNRNWKIFELQRPSLSYHALVLKKHTQQNKPVLPDHITRNEVNRVVRIRTQVDKNGRYWPRKIPWEEECSDDESSYKQMSQQKLLVIIIEGVPKIFQFFQKCHTWIFDCLSDSDSREVPQHCAHGCRTSHEVLGCAIYILSHSLVLQSWLWLSYRKIFK